ncbi:MAG: hypothetical protein KKA76_15880 [Proteobacteria bacterium]|nr:hypothetical protein [Pseudomonadota bacterium]
MAKKWLELSAVFFLMLALAIISTYPLILHFDTGIPYAPWGGPMAWNRSGDQIQLLYWFWLVKENFIGSIPFDTNPYEFNMLISHVTSGLNSIPLAFLYMLFTPFGDVAAYNCTILSSYVLAGVFMYLLVRLYSDSRIGALLGAIIFTFAPSRINGFVAGHGYGFLYFSYPFILFFLEKGIRSKKIRYGFLSGLGLICLAMLEPHLIYYICVFLGVYIPVRTLSLLPVYRDDSVVNRHCNRMFSWSTRRSLFFLWGTGAATVFYAQILFSYRDHDPLVSHSFWWIIAVYPLIPVLVSFCCAALYQRVTPLTFRQSLAVESGSLLPLFLLLLICGLACLYKPVDTTLLVVAALGTVVVTKFVILRQYLFLMLKVLADGIWTEKRKILPILPVIFSMGAIVYWIAATKVNKVASTIASGGRTLDDVGLYSARLSDLFLSISHVYIGTVPAVLGGGLLLTLLFSVAFNKHRDKFSQETELLTLFYVVTAFCCFILALGLAFGKSSLYILFYHYFPFFNYPRVSNRIITLVLFSLAIITGFVVKYIQGRCTRRISCGAVTLLVLAAAGLQLKDFNIMKPMGINVLDKGQDVYTHVKENIGEGLLLEIPLWPGDSHQSSLYQHYIMLDRVNRVNGCSPLVLSEYIETVFEPLAPINQGRLGRKQYDLLLEMGVKFITVHDNRDIFLEKVSPFVPLTTVRRLKNSPYLEFVDIDNSIYFKTFEKKNENLYLFRLKDRESVDDSDQPAWYEMPYFYDVNSRLHQQTGEIVEDKDIGRRVYQATAGKNGPGFMVYGPYDTYTPGAYRCYFTIYLDADLEDNVARIEVSSLTGNDEQVVIGQRELKGNDRNRIYRKEYLDFSITENTKLEFRVFYYGKGSVRVEKIAVNKIGHDTPLTFLKAENMVGDTGQLVYEKDASTGKVVEAIVGKSKNGDMVYGPNRIYKKGRYKARFYLKMKDGTDHDGTDTVSILSVTDGQNLTVFSKRNVMIKELSDNGFTGIDTEFELNRDEELSFHVWFTGKVGLQLDGIEIIRQ